MADKAETADINDAGMVAGSYVNSSAFLYQNGAATPIPFPGAFKTMAVAINARGMLLAGLGVIGVALRRRSSTAGQGR
ncbi:hypothetical protein GCM10027277_35380 [Pseudoduganella ginsengisoli]|uniref:IPTL-CTERM sorting domain-containing protein n=1 Tax=Pseudoduganella ginsengisoli TaxID=1462440 RepID=A0A6L6PZG8_9BURK|nr:hypothetical protein [Pseudoduganella ginsengisoli]MTW02162.1 hypothetical protein [Pseudoduganella ginsengisoli]